MMINLGSQIFRWILKYNLENQDRIKWT